MGSVRFSAIPAWEGDREIDPDASGPIAGYRATDAVTLTEVYIDEKMNVEFGKEQGGFELWRGRPLEVRNEDTPIRLAQRLMTIEVSTGDAKRKGHMAVIGYRPVSMNWCGWSPFKTVSKRPAAQMAQLLKTALDEPKSQENALWTKLSSLKTDPFGNEDHLYARFRQLERTDSLGAPDDYYDEDDRLSVTGSKPNRKVRKDGDPEITLGVCEDFEACRKALESSQLLIDSLTEASDGRFRMYDGSIHPLSPDAQSVARELMTSAIVQALSGLGSHDLPKLNAKAVANFGAAAALARSNFGQNLENFDKRHKKNESGIFINELPEVEQRAPVTRPERSSLKAADIESRIANSKMALRKVKPDQFPYLWVQITERLRDESDYRDDGAHERGQESPFRTKTENAMIVAAALSSISAMPEYVIERLRRLRSHYPHFVNAALGHEVE